jgi:DNA segregation ATPase FtsK/SpoIIIE-like protein/type IV secretory pathway VirB2 component (pilin)
MKAEAKSDAKRQGLAHELWGVSAVVLGLLTLIATISCFVNHENNILGPYLGRYLAAGLIFFFGNIAVFLVPAAIIATGIGIFRGAELTLRRALLWVVLTAEICILLAIPNLPAMARIESIEQNALGTIITYLLYKIFGPHRFGPYFLTGFLLLCTVVIGLQMNFRDIFMLLARLGRKMVAVMITPLLARFEHMRANRRARAAARAATQAAEPAKPVKIKAPKREVPAVADPKVEPTAEQLTEEIVAFPDDTVPASEEDEARKRYEEELAAFRAKKKEPIKISSPEADDSVVEVTEDAVGAEENTRENALVQTALIGSEKDEFMKVPAEVAPKKLKKPSKPYIIPACDILPDPPMISTQIDRNAIEVHSHILEKTLLNFGVEGKVVNVSPGPVVTRYEIELAPGIKISRVVSLHDDLSMAVGGKKIRIEAPIPGKAAVGIELPNEDRQMVYFKHIMLSDAFRKSKFKLPIIIGKTISGAPYVTDIRKMPHLLIAGQTGSGKSVCINTIICSLLMTKKPDELRLILIDPKKVELSYYEGIPHLMSPVVTESKEAVSALQWGVHEMMRRYKLLGKAFARDIDTFNKKVEDKTIQPGTIADDDNKLLPFIVIIVDELADLMLTASRDVEGLIQRIAQLARAVGIHLIVATQRPSVDIITGSIKANLTSRIGFRTIQSNDSRTILGHIGAEKLLGNGDMLFLRSGAPEIERFQGAFISEQDVEMVVSSINSQQYDIEKIESFRIASAEANEEGLDPYTGDEEGRDDLFDEAARLIVSVGQGSTSLLQRRLKLGYARAGRVMDELHLAGIVGPQEGSKMREVMIAPEELEPLLENLRKLV